MEHNTNAPVRLAVCQSEGGEGLYVPLVEGEAVTPCFQDCDCTPAVYVHESAHLEHVPAPVQMVAERLETAERERDEALRALERAGRALNRAGWIEESQAALDACRAAVSP